jgi:hypothetical protein
LSEIGFEIHSIGKYPERRIDSSECAV